MEIRTIRISPAVRETSARNQERKPNASQARFEAMFPGRTPKTDTRTPADIRAGVTLS